MAYDLVIRNGTVVDGTGADALTTDVAIDGDRVVAIGAVDESGRREINADGRLVTPGFVDIHTHLDAQLAWDPTASSSCWHGVTSIVVGNCGVTFAPVRAADHEYLAAMMESVEDIPKASILDGLPWDWEGYAGYLDWLDRTPKGLHVGGMVGHSAVRYYVMGERALDADQAPTVDDLTTMQALVANACSAGALGFSSSRTLRHRVPDGRYVPGTWATADELLALAEMVGPGRVLEVAPRFDGDGPSEPRVEQELAWMDAVSRGAGCTVTFNVTQTREQGAHYKLALARAHAANERGARIRPQTSPRFIGLLTGLAHRTPFDAHPSWQALQPLSLAERLVVLRDPDRRAQLVAEARNDRAGLDVFFVLNAPDGTARYDCDPNDSLPAVADRRGVTPVEAFIDLTLETDGALLLSWPLLNQETEAIAEMLVDPVVLLGLADAGAHVGQTMDASAPTHFLTYWVRDRGLMSIESAIQRLTSDTASTFGIDRGVLRVGAIADVNVIDFDALALPVPDYRHDFPHGAGRFAQGARGYDYTIVAGAVFMDHGEHTGALTGQVLRARLTRSIRFVVDALAFYGLEHTDEGPIWRLPVVRALCSGLGALFGGCGLGASLAVLEHVTGRETVWATAQFTEFARPPAVVELEVVEVVRGHASSQARVFGRVGDREIFTVVAALGRRALPWAGEWAERPIVAPPDDCPPRELRPDHAGTIAERMEVRAARLRRLEDLDGTPTEDGRSAVWVRNPWGQDAQAAALAIVGDFVPMGISQASGRRLESNSLDNTLRIARVHPTEWILADIRVHAVADGFGHGLVHLWAEDGTLLATASQSTIVRDLRTRPRNDEKQETDR